MYNGGLVLLLLLNEQLKKQYRAFIYYRLDVINFVFSYVACVL